MNRTQLSQLAVLAAVAAHRSFRAAGKELSIAPSAVSHAVSSLEESLGVRLLARTTRSVSPTEEGKVLLERLVWAAAEGLPFERLGVMINNQTFTKTANCWGVDNGTKGTNTNRIVLLRRT